jgi:N-acyl homoserine lactone hydrolase
MAEQAVMAPTVGLTALPCGMGRAAPGWFFASEAKNRRQALGIGVRPEDFLPSPLGAFLIDHEHEGLVLVDAGVHPRAVTDLRADFGRLNARFFAGLRVTPEQTVVAHLGRLGLRPADVSVVVMTHLHVDHASGMTTLPEARFVIARSEWQAAHRWGAARWGYVRHQFPAEDRCELIDFETGSEPWGGFAQTVDLFEDGTVRLISTPGHTLGHLSVAVRAATGVRLLVGDAAYTMRNIDRQELPYRNADAAAAAATLAALARHRAAHPDTLFIPTHDQQAWEALERAGQGSSVPTAEI